MAKNRNAVTQNWLLNPTGKANAFVEIDLVQEHLNFWIKVSIHHVNWKQVSYEQLSVCTRLKAGPILGTGWR